MVSLRTQLRLNESFRVVINIGSRYNGEVPGCFRPNQHHPGINGALICWHGFNITIPRQVKMWDLSRFIRL